MPKPGTAAKSYSIDTRVGRLIEARVFGLQTREDADSYALALGTHTLRMPKDRMLVLCADHRPVFIYRQPVADRLTELFLQMNSRLDRIAIVVARSNATLVLQLDRLIREARHEGRRLCYEPEDAMAHLAPVLDTAELKRMRDFLAEHPARS